MSALLTSSFSPSFLFSVFMCPPCVVEGHLMVVPLFFVLYESFFDQAEISEQVSLSSCVVLKTYFLFEFQASFLLLLNEFLSHLYAWFVAKAILSHENVFSFPATIFSFKFSSDSFIVVFFSNISTQT